MSSFMIKNMLRDTLTSDKIPRMLAEGGPISHIRGIQHGILANMDNFSSPHLFEDNAINKSATPKFATAVSNKVKKELVDTASGGVVHDNEVSESEAVSSQRHDSAQKPAYSYVAIIAMAILESKYNKLVLSDIYKYILDKYPYFKDKGQGWRNSVRHNLSLNQCFAKAGRAENGKGNYWTIHPANVEDFKKGDFRRRLTRRTRRKYLSVNEMPLGNPLNSSVELLKQQNPLSDELLSAFLRYNICKRSSENQKNSDPSNHNITGEMLSDTHISTSIREGLTKDYQIMQDSTSYLFSQASLRTTAKSVGENTNLTCLLSESRGKQYTENVAHSPLNNLPSGSSFLSSPTLFPDNLLVSSSNKQHVQNTNSTSTSSINQITKADIMSSLLASVSPLLATSPLAVSPFLKTPPLESQLFKTPLATSQLLASYNLKVQEWMAICEKALNKESL